MRNIIYLFLSYMAISTRASQREVYGGGKKKIPKKLRILFPLLLLRREKCVFFDIFYMILWHLYFYSWIYMSIKYKSITIYTNEFGVIFICFMLIYALCTMGVQKNYDEWKNSR